MEGGAARGIPGTLEQAIDRWIDDPAIGFRRTMPRNLRLAVLLSVRDQTAGRIEETGRGSNN